MTARPPRLALAIDVGGTTIKSALVDAEGLMTRVERHPTGGDTGPAAVVAGIIALAADLHRQAAAAGVVVAVGLALPGVVEESTGVGVLSANLGWRAVPFGELVHRRLGLPVAVRHDVRAGAMAEGRFGAAVGAHRFLFVPIGTGIGGAIVADGRAEPGAHWRATEIGHLLVRPDGPRCGCGGRGCLEAVASGGAIARAYAAVSTRTASDRNTDASEVVRRALAGEPAAAAVWAEAVAALGDGIAAAVTLLDPDLVVVGGGLAAAGPALFDPLRARVAERLTLQGPPPVLPARLGADAGCLGAGLAAWDLLSAERAVPA